MADIEWRFADADDAARYLSEVRRLWLAWLIGLGGLMFTEGWWVVVAGVVTVGLLLALARPLQARAAAMVPEDTLVGGRFNVVGRGTARDRVLKQLAYGKAPLERAVEVAGTGGWLIAARSVMIGLTVLAFVYVVVISLDAPASA